MIRYTVFALTIIAAIAAIFLYPSPIAMLAMALSFPLVALGTYDCWQSKHAVYRNYPIIGHVRALFESIRPQIRQYLIESDTDGMPFDREERTLVYQRAKNVEDKKPFGTELDVYGDGYEWINHSISPRDVDINTLRVTIGGEECKQPYCASLLNISAMSYGSLGGNAVAALNKGAAIGRFAQDTGEGGISRFHREHGGDLIWEIGSGYFGCRNTDGSFDSVSFSEIAQSPQVKMVELKLSQGAKPGQGGVLPGAKVTAEIAAARGVAIGSDCISPARHSTFRTPVEMLEFINNMRELSGGKPAGFKLCIGHPWEIMAISKAMISTGIIPDFIVVDGSEGGTGAAPVEFSDHIGMPLREGLVLTHNVLLGCGLRDKIRIGASGKIVSGFNIAANIALGADWCNAARGFMFSLGCIQSQHCHKGNCPTGIATQDKLRQAGLNVEHKAQQVAEFHSESIKVLSKIIGAAGLSSSADLAPEHLMIRQDTDTILSAKTMYRYLASGALLTSDQVPEPYRQYWCRTSAEQFQLI